MYPVAYEADFAEPRNRLTTFFRGFLAIPHWLMLFFYGIVAGLAVMVAWFAIVITGNYPPALHSFVAGFLRYLNRVQGYVYYLTDVYPPFDGGEHPEYPIRLQVGAPLAEYSRVKTFFRYFLAIPIMVMRYVMGLLVMAGAFAAWIVILITGKQPQGLQEILVLGTSYTIRSDAYFFLLTETYPPFSQDMKAAIESEPGGTGTTAGVGTSTTAVASEAGLGGPTPPAGT